MSAEGSMWAAAVEQAFRAGCNPPDGDRKNDMGGATPSEAANEWRWLTAPHGPWAESRIRICNLNGVDPEIVRQEALRRGASRQAVFGLRHEMRREDAKPQPKPKPAPAKKPPKDNSARIALCAAVAAAWADGVDADKIAAQFCITRGAVAGIARTAKAKRPKWFLLQSAAKASILVKARNAERNAEIMERHARGETFAGIGRAMGMKWTTVRCVVRSASAVGEVRGGDSRAGGGGVSLSSFHDATVPAERGA